MGLHTGWLGEYRIVSYVRHSLGRALMSRAVREERGKYIPPIVICFSDDQSQSVGSRQATGTPAGEAGPAEAGPAATRGLEDGERGSAEAGAAATNH